MPRLDKSLVVYLEAVLSRLSTIALWYSIPAVYRQCVKVYMNFLEIYLTVMPIKGNGAVGKDSSLTSYIESLTKTSGREAPDWKKTPVFPQEDREPH